MQFSRSLMFFMLLLVPPLAFAQTGARYEATLPVLIDRLLDLHPVVPTTLADVERATGLQFHEEMHGAREWVSGAFTLADGVQVDGVELRIHSSDDSSIRLISIRLARNTCLQPDTIVSRYALTELTPPNPAPAPPAAGYPVSNEPIAYHMGRYRRMPWGLFVVSFDQYSPKDGLPTCTTGITLRDIHPNEERNWP